MGRRQKPVNFLVLTLAVGLFVSCNFLRGEEETIESVKSKAPIAWARYLEALTNIECAYYSESISGDGTETSNTTKISHTPPYHLAITLSDGIETAAYGNNACYSFRLTSKNGKTWGTDSVEQLSSQNEAPLHFPKLGERQDGTVLQERISWDSSHLAAALKLNFFVWFPSYFNEEGFEILGVENLYEDDLHLVKVRFQYEPKEFDPNIPLRGGEVVLLPDYLWVVKRAVFETVEPADQSQIPCQTEIDYDLSPGRLALPRAVTVKVDHYNLTTKWFYTWKEGCRLNKKMFTLSRFGLSEPDFGEARVGRHRLLLSLLGGLAILLALYQIYKKRRQEREG